MSTLKKILIKTRRQIFSEIPGNNPSIFEGEGYDFVELREYHYGDDVRRIDWNVTAKMRRPYIKVYKEERELNIVIVSLLGGSVYFGQKRLKQELFAEVAALLAFSAAKNGDLFSGFIHTRHIDASTRPTKRIHGVNALVAQILAFEPIGKSVDTQALSRHLYERIQRRSILFVLGDFFGDYDFRLLSKKHEVIALILRDRLEEQPPELGMLRLSDPETLRSATMQIDERVAERYRAKVRANDEKLYRHFRRNRIDFTKIYTQEEPFVKLSKLFLRR